MTDTADFMLGIAGAHWSAPVLVVDAAYTGPVAERFYWKMTDDDRAVGCRIDRGTGRLYVMAVVQCLMDPERAYARFLGLCNMCVYMFSAESDTFNANLESDYEPFLRAYHASHRRIPFVALVNERRPVSVQERLDHGRVRAVLPVGVPLLETAFPHPPRSDGHAMFLEFVDRILNVPLPPDQT